MYGVEGYLDATWIDTMDWIGRRPVGAGDNARRERGGRRGRALTAGDDDERTGLRVRRPLGRPAGRGRQRRSLLARLVVERKAPSRGRTRRRRWQTIAVTLVLLLLSGDAAASVVTATGQLDHSAMNLLGRIRADMSLTVLQATGDEGGLLMDGAGSAVRLIVNSTRRDRVGAGSSNAENESLVGVAKGPTQQAEASFEYASWTIESVQHNANVTLEPITEGSARTALLELDRSDIVASAERHWTAGQDSDDVQTGDPPMQLQRGIRVPAGLPLLETERGQFSTMGDYWIHLWGVNLTVTDREGNKHAYRSGAWIDNATGPGGQGAVRDHHYQFVRVRLEQASGNLSVSSGLVRAVGSRSVVEVEGTMFARVREGLLEEASRTVTVQDEDLRIEGKVELDIGPSEKPQELHSDLEFQGSATTATGDLFPPQAGLYVRLAPLAPRVALVSLGIGFAGLLVGLGIRRRGDSALSLAAAEDALVARRPREALRHARAVLRQDKLDPDALLILAASRLQGGKERELLREVEPAASRLPPERAGGLALVLALAHMRLGHADAAIRWVKVACLERPLRERLLLDPLFQPLRSHPEYGRLVDDPDPTYG